MLYLRGSVMSYWLIAKDGMSKDEEEWNDVESGYKHFATLNIDHIISWVI